jgi:hypothetical protein
LVEIRLSGQAQPANLTGLNLAQLQGVESGAVGGVTAGGASSLMSSWQMQHAANASSVAAASMRGTGTGFGGSGSGSGVASDFIRALSTPNAGAPIGSVLGFLRDIDSVDHRISARLSGASFSQGWPGFGGGGGPGGGGGAPVAGIPMPPQGWPTPPAFLQRQRNQPPPPPPGGGGGGGGGGSPGGGGGGGGGFHIPGAGFVGLGSTSRLLTGAVGAATAAAAAEELFFAPQRLGGLEGSALGNAAPYRNLTYDSYAMGRAGGFSGKGLMNSLYDGYKPPEWMERLGLGPTEALRIQSNFGISQRSVGDSTDLIKAIGGAKFLPAFSGLNVEDSIGQSARYGFVGGNADGVQTYFQQMAPIMTMAVEQGLDRASILKSIDIAIGSSVRNGGGIGASLEGLGAFITRYTDLPGGRTGEAGLDAAQRYQAANATVGQDPLRTMIYGDATGKLTTRDSLRGFLNKAQPGYFEKFDANPVGHGLLQSYFDAQKAGNRWAAASYLREIVGGGGGVIGGNPQAEQELLTNNPFINQLPGYMKGLAIGIHGQTPGLYSQGQNGPGGDIVTKAYDQLRQSGLDNNAASAVLANMNTETGGFNPYASNTKGGGQGAHGLLQLRGERLTNYRRRYGHMPDDTSVSPEQLTREAVEFMRMEQTQPGADSGAYQSGQDIAQSRSAEDSVDYMRNEYSRPGNVPQRYVDEQHAYARAYSQQYAGRDVGIPSLNDAASAGGAAAGSGPSNMPTDALKAQADALAGTMKGSEVSFGEMNVIIPWVNQQLHDLAVAAAGATKVMKDMGVLNPTFGNPWNIPAN